MKWHNANRIADEHEREVMQIETSAYEGLYRELTGHHSKQCHCDDCIPARMDEIAIAVRDDLALTPLERVFVYITDGMLALVAFLMLILAVAETLPVEAVAVVWIALAVCSYMNHRELRI